MGEGPGQERTQLTDDQDKSAEQLRAEIEDVREDLGDTAAALAAKTDVKTRARERADEVKRNAMAKKDELLSKTRSSAPGEDGMRSFSPALSPRSEMRRALTRLAYRCWHPARR